MACLPGDDPRQVLHRDAKAVGIEACIAVRTEMLVQQAEEATSDRGSVCGRRLYRPAIYLKGSLPGGDQKKHGADEGISARCIGREEAEERLRLTRE